MAEKSQINVAIIGHVDSGKSTLTGQLALRLGGLDERTLDKLKKEADERNKGSFSYAFYTDRSTEERDRGVTIQTTLVKMETDKFNINILDCPGHADYIKNATSGCKQSDLSIVVCPARFEASCSSEGTLKTHLTLAAILGSKNFIVCINKIDEVQIVNENSLKTGFEAACEAVYAFLKKLAVKRENVIFLPISALNGIGLFNDSKTYPFYEGSPMKDKSSNKTVLIKTLEQAINFQEAPLRALEKSLRMPISSIAHVPGHGTVLCGRVDYGIINKGDQVKILPNNVISKVKSIEAHKTSIGKAEAGLNIGFTLELKDKATVDKIKVGSIVGVHEDSKFIMAPLYKVSCISMKKSKVSASEKTGIKEGYTPVISCGTANIACKFAKLLSCITKDKETIDAPNVIPSNARFEAIIYPTKPALFECASDFPGLGKFICRDSGILVVAGQIIGKVSEQEAKEVYGLDMAVLSGDKDAIKKSKAKK
ncbi:protein translation elongation factor EF-1A [Nucleospora cyclopteri]